MLTQPEPWMRGPIDGLEPLVAPVFYSFTQVREELAHYTEGLTTEQVWRQVNSLPTLGFHLRHIAGSVDRLMTYLTEGEISPEQIAQLKSEGQPGASLHELLAGIDAALLRPKASCAQSKPRTSTPRATSAANASRPACWDSSCISPNIRNGI